MRKLLLFFILFYAALNAFSQGMVQIKGVIYDADSNAVLEHVTIIVKHTSRIMQNNTDGSFSVFVKPSDTLIFGIYGYRVKYLCLKDSAPNTDYLKVKIQMYHFSEEISEVTIKEARTQREVRRDVKNLVAEYVFSLDRTNLIQSPITFFYEKNSKKALSKRLLVEYEFELEKNKLIGQLLDIYNAQEIIQVPPSEYKEFTKSLNLSWEYLMGLSDYDLAFYIKQKALEWKN